MTALQILFFLAVSFCASVAGAICGIGGGVIIKPVLDLFGWASVSTISFLSGCTVLSMTCYSVGKSISAKENKIQLRTGTPLAIGAAVGGVAGKQMFGVMETWFADPNTIGSVQAACLALLTLGTLVYTLKKQSIRTFRMQNPLACILIGLFLGICSSFLGIGGGPINLVVLYFFFDMDTKTAAANSLYIILFSQVTSLFSTLLTHSVPAFDPVCLVFMVLGGILGGMAGRRVNQKLDNRAVEKLFVGLMGVIILISVYNIYQYAAV